MNYESYDSLILSSSGSVCYLCDIENYDLIHLTKAGMQIYGMTDPSEYQGKKCYEVLQGRSSPCPFCNNSKLSQGESIRWEHYNEKLSRWFDVTDTLLCTDGRLCRMEIARDITARKAESLSGDLAGMSMEDVLFRCLHVLATERDMEKAVNQFLAEVGSYYKAARTYIFEFDFKKQVTNNTFEWCGPGVSQEIHNLQNVPLAVVDDWLRKFESDGVFAISSLDDERDPNSEEYRLLQMQGIHSLLAAPLTREKQIVGFIGVDDPEQNERDTGLLRSVSEFILAELERRRLMQELERINFTDVLTGVFNRNGYRKALRQMQTQPPATLGVAILSLNGMKRINERLGQKYGDDMIVRTAQSLCARMPGQVCRIGGDEFAVFCPNITSEEFEAAARRLQQELLQEQDYSASFGYDWTDQPTDVNGQLLRAEKLMRAQKQRYYQQEITQGRAVGNATDDLFRDIEDRRFVMRYQPQIDLRSGEVTGVEALVRKLDENGDILPPVQFLPYYEARGLMQHLDMHVLELVLQDMKQLYAQGLQIQISVNFSRSTLLDGEFAREVADKCEACGVPVSAITVEITENVADLSRETIRKLLKTIRQAGMRLSLDDFGTEYSNLSILTDVEFDEVKFDKSLVDEICTSGRNQIVLGRLIQMCRQLQQSRIVAEGIESAGQVDILKSYGCDCGQGYYFHKPMPLEELQTMLRSRQVFPTASVQKTSDSFLSGQDYSARYTLEEVLLQLINGGGDLYGYRIEGRRGLFSQRIAKDRRIPAQVYDFPQWLVDQGAVHQDSIGDWLALFSAIHRGDKQGSARVSFRVEEERFHQFYLRFNSFADEEGNPFFATVSFENVERENEQTQKQSQDIAGLVQAMQKSYPEILTVNLDRDTYRMFSYHGGTTVGTPKEGRIDDVIRLRSERVVPEDRQSFLETMGAEALRRSFIHEGKDQIRLVYRRPDNRGDTIWFETVVMRQDNPSNDDILLIAMSRSIDQQKAEEVRLREQLWLQMEELRVTTGRMRRTICIYDVREKTLTLPQEYAERNALPAVLQEYPQAYLRTAQHLDGQTREKIAWFYKSICDGVPEGSCEIGSQSPREGTRWMRWEFATVYDRQGAPRRAVIFVEDVTEQRKIQSRAERDGMTGLLNRTTTQERTIRLMAQDSPGILLHIDLDDLKHINDTYGHGEGDKALQGLATTLQRHFRDSDVVGRIGGDEFLVYLPGAAANASAISASVEALLEKLEALRVGTQNERQVKCSIGCAVQTAQAQTFQELYRKADMALYHVKRSGKNSFAFYAPQMEQSDYLF